MMKFSNEANKIAIAWFQILSLCLLFLVACNSASTKEVESEIDQVVPPSALESRFDEVRAIHDEVMPERGRLIRLQRSVAGGDLGVEVTAFAKTRIERADEMMMNWMYADIPLTTLVDSLEEASIYTYLETREKDIKEVSDSMMTAIQFAESILAQ